MHGANITPHVAIGFARMFTCWSREALIFAVHNRLGLQAEVGRS